MRIGDGEGIERRKMFESHTIDLILNSHLYPVGHIHQLSNSDEISKVCPDISFRFRLLPRSDIIVQGREVGSRGLLGVRRRIWSPLSCYT